MVTPEQVVNLTSRQGKLQTSCSKNIGRGSEPKCRLSRGKASRWSVPPTRSNFREYQPTGC
eukprot:3330088-Amphidinium_carterae.1